VDRYQGRVVSRNTKRYGVLHTVLDHELPVMGLREVPKARHPTRTWTVDKLKDTMASIQIEQGRSRLRANEEGTQHTNPKPNRPSDRCMVDMGLISMTVKQSDHNIHRHGKREEVSRPHPRPVASKLQLNLVLVLVLERYRVIQSP
jgi:hypothetical protein